MVLFLYRYCSQSCYAKSPFPLGSRSLNYLVGADFIISKILSVFKRPSSVNFNLVSHAKLFLPSLYVGLIARETGSGETGCSNTGSSWLLQVLQWVTAPLNRMTMGTPQNLLHSEVGPLLKCYVGMGICAYKSGMPLVLGWWHWLRLCHQERQIQNKCLFLKDCITGSSGLKGTHCRQLGTMWPVGLLKE